MLPRVTIGVCVKNGAATIQEVIESIASQTYPHELMEVIFVDDGSEDKSLSIINTYASKLDMNVKVFQHEWKGLGFSRNVVVNNASGKYIIWVDCDMVLPKDHVKKQVEYMEQNPKIGIGKAKYGFFREGSLVAFLENVLFTVNDSKRNPLNSKLPGTGGAIYRIEAIRMVGGFDEDLRGVGEDQDVAYRIKAIGWHIKRTPAHFYERRVESWPALLRKYIWYGYGNYHLYRKNRNIFSLFRMNPIAGFFAGLLHIPVAYRLTQNKVVFLLPIHFLVKFSAWCYGFAKSQTSFQSWK
jgi:glycosyltransferase involved in cell wall biosynthesis